MLRLPANRSAQLFANVVVAIFDLIEFLLGMGMIGILHLLYRARNLFITSSPGIGVTTPSSISLSRRSASSAQRVNPLLILGVQALK
jgi:hypothetical protein